jgi:hypothetical protein
MTRIVKLTSEMGEHAYRQIWDRLPERQNGLSSVWWFFLLFPRQARGYGPAQIMFMAGSKVGRFFVDGMPAGGMPGRVEATGQTEQIPAFTLGWMHDGERLHERLLHDVCRMELDPGGRLETLPEEDGTGSPHVSLMPLPDRPFGMRAVFEGKRGGGRFDVWGDPASVATSPVVSIDRPHRVGGGHVIGWERLAFAGDFRTPAGTEHHEGVGFFQRVVANSPWIPWKWVYIVFEDASIFSCFMPFLGPHLMRRRYGFFPQRLEQLAVAPLQMGMFSDGGTGTVVKFDEVRVIPRVSGGELARFDIQAVSRHGNRLTVRAAPYERAGFTLSRPLLGKLRTRYVYNEYLLRADLVEGVLSGRSIDPSRLGTGYGNCEYNWGFTV